MIAGAGRWPTRLRCTSARFVALVVWRIFGSVGIDEISKVHLKPLEMDPLGADQSSVELRDRLESPGDNSK